MDPLGGEQSFGHSGLQPRVERPEATVWEPQLRACSSHVHLGAPFLMDPQGLEHSSPWALQGSEEAWFTELPGATAVLFWIWGAQTR